MNVAGRSMAMTLAIMKRLLERSNSYFSNEARTYSPTSEIERHELHQYEQEICYIDISVVRRGSGGGGGDKQRGPWYTTLAREAGRWLGLGRVHTRWCSNILFIMVRQ